MSAKSIGKVAFPDKVGQIIAVAKQLERSDAVSSIRSAITRYGQGVAKRISEVRIVLDDENFDGVASLLEIVMP